MDQFLVNFDTALMRYPSTNSLDPLNKKIVMPEADYLVMVANSLDAIDLQIHVERKLFKSCAFCNKRRCKRYICRRRFTLRKQPRLENVISSSDTPNDFGNIF